jgi:hypothetical protein
MDWVKRNLAFVIGAAVAVGLLAFSGYYLYSNSKKNNEAREQLEAEYAELKRLHNLDPHPGKGDVDNIQAAREQVEVLQDAMGQVASRFEPIPAIPSAKNVTGEQFSGALRRTIEQLNRGARAASVIVPTNYNFSFEAESRLVRFAPGSLDKLAVQLGEIKAICEILFDAKVNELTGLRRERVSADDMKGPRTDYLSRSTVSNELAFIAPYELSFESFSAELADVLSGFANSPHGLVIKDMTIVPARTAARRGTRGGAFGEFDEAGGIYASPYPPVAPAQPATPVYPPAYEGAGEYGSPYGASEYGSPYGGGLGAPGPYGGGGGGGIRRPEIRRPTFERDQAYGGNPYGNQPYGNPYGAAATQPQPYPYGAQYGQPAATAQGASQTIIDEHPLSVTIQVRVIRLRPPEEEESL